MSTTAPEQPTAPGAAPAELPRSGGEILQRIRQGEMGSVRVIILLAVIWTIFQVQESRFLSAVNLTNLVLQITAVGLISVGVVLVLLLGEIDLSVGAVSGLCASIMAVLNVKHGWAPVPAVLAGIAAGAAIGLFQGFVSTRFGIPSFVVTLAGLLGWQGAQLKVLGETGTVNLSPGFITDLTGNFLSKGAGWIVGIACVALFAVMTLVGRQRRAAAGLAAPSPALLAVRIGAVAIATLVAIYVVNQDRGVPVAALILVGFVAGIDFITRRTRFGRHIYAVGGNAEAARRAGIHVSRVRITVFMIGSSMAAIGGIMAASRLLAVNQSSGGSDLLLNAIAGPVIAGTSLFGGRGSVWSALLGALVIGSISNGMDLLALQSSVKFMITGAVLLLAVTIDALARAQRTARRARMTRPRGVPWRACPRCTS
jgi:D-xylose transport system permease protein